MLTVLVFAIAAVGLLGAYSAATRPPAATWRNIFIRLSWIPVAIAIGVPGLIAVGSHFSPHVRPLTVKITIIGLWISAAFTIVGIVSLLTGRAARLGTLLATALSSLPILIYGFALLLQMIAS
jgi:hypothetical protein